MSDKISIDYFNVRKSRSLYQKILDKVHNLLSDKTSKVQPPDYLFTIHNKSFIEDEVFHHAYASAIENVNDDYRIPWRIQQSLWAAHHCYHLEGDFVELGTGNGFFFHAGMAAMERWAFLDKAVYLYDIFELFEDSGKGRQHSDRVYCSDLEAVQGSFSRFPYVHLIKGDVRKTIKAENHPKISFLHVDLNDPQTEIACLDVLWNNITPGGIILLDDFANSGFESSFQLHTDYFSNRGKRILSTPSGQGIVLI